MTAYPDEGGAVTATAPELSPHELTLLVLVTRRTVGRLTRFLLALENEDALNGAWVTFVYPRACDRQVRRSVEGLTRVRTVRAPTNLKRDIARAVSDDRPFVTTKYVTALELRGNPRLHSVYDQASAAYEELAGVESGRWGPLLLDTKRTPNFMVGGYADCAVQAEHSGAALPPSYVASLVLATAEPHLESVDPHDGEAELRVWLKGVPPLVSPRPAWLFRLLLVDGAGATIASTPVTLSARTDRIGRQNGADVIARLPLAQGRSGEYRLIIESSTDGKEWRQRQSVTPRKGVLLNARTVLLRPSEGDGVPIRYLVHTTDNAKETRFTLQRGDLRKDRLRWLYRRLKKDLSFLIRRRHPAGLRALTLVRWVTSPAFAGREIWLIGERFDTAQDNGLHFFRYLRTETSVRSVYYVIDRNSPQRERVSDVGHVVAHSSIRHRLLMLHADVLANAYSLDYLIPRQWNASAYAQHLAWRIGAFRLYLKHGVHLSPAAVNRGSSGYDMLLTATPQETEALRAASGYSQQLVETGLPRYDALIPTGRTHTILFTSTWRRYLVQQVFGGYNRNQIPFEGSQFEVFMRGFLGSRRLQEILDRHGYRLLMHPHYNMAHYFRSIPIAGDRVELVDTDHIPFQQLIRECDAFITDHSSVHFDMAYLGTPLIYARFDEKDFSTKHAIPGWFDYERDGFGPVTHSLTETLDALEELLQRECAPDPFYTARIDQTFTFRDLNNCARVTGAVQQRLAAHRRGLHVAELFGRRLQA